VCVCVCVCGVCVCVCVVWCVCVCLCVCVCGVCVCVWMCVCGVCVYVCGVCGVCVCVWCVCVSVCVWCGVWCVYLSLPNTFKTKSQFSTALKCLTCCSVLQYIDCGQQTAHRQFVSLHAALTINRSLTSPPN